MSVSDVVLKELENITGTDQVRKDLSLDLFGEKVLDSFGTLELLLALSEALDVRVTPGDIDRAAWATPQKIIDYFEERVKSA